MPHRKVGRGNGISSGSRLKKKIPDQGGSRGITIAASDENMKRKKGFIAIKLQRGMRESC